MRSEEPLTKEEFEELERALEELAWGDALRDIRQALVEEFRA